MTTRLMMIIPTLVQGGAEKQMSLLAAGLPKDEFDVSVCVLTHTGPWESFLQQHEIPVTVIGKRFKADIIAAGRLLSHIKKLKPDIVHTWIFAANSYGRIAARLAGVPHVVAGERCVDLWKTEKHFWLDRKLAKRTDAIVTNSSGVVDFYAEHGIDRSKFSVVPNGISTEGFSGLDPNQRVQNHAEAKKRWCEKLKIPNNSHLIVSLARLWPQKRLKDVIWAIDLVNCTQENVHLVIAGDGPEAEALKKFSQETRTENNVHFVGHLNASTEILTAADVFVLASEYEGQSNSLMEAILHQVPVVVSDIPGNRDLVPDDSFGRIFQVGDRAGLAKAMLAGINEIEANSARVHQAHQRIIHDFSLPKMIESYADLYRQILQKGNR